MTAVISLISAIIGGSLVLLGDGIRRAAEERRDRRQRLVDAAVEMAVSQSRIAGRLKDARERHLPLSEISPLEIDRYEAATRFWTTPGSMTLLPPGNDLTKSWRVLIDSYAADDIWASAWESYLRALRSFESAIRRHQGDSGGDSARLGLLIRRLCRQGLSGNGGRGEEGHAGGAGAIPRC